jgi:hypothetical protein
MWSRQSSNEALRLSLLKIIQPLPAKWGEFVPSNKDSCFPMRGKIPVKTPAWVGVRPPFGTPDGTMPFPFTVDYDLYGKIFAGSRMRKDY